MQYSPMVYSYALLWRSWNPWESVYDVLIPESGIITVIPGCGYAYKIVSVAGRRRGVANHFKRFSGITGAIQHSLANALREAHMVPWQPVTVKNYMISEYSWHILKVVGSIPSVIRFLWRSGYALSAGAPRSTANVTKTPENIKNVRSYLYIISMISVN